MSVCGNFLACWAFTTGLCIGGCEGAPPPLCTPGCTTILGALCHHQFPCLGANHLTFPGPRRLLKMRIDGMNTIKQYVHAIYRVMRIVALPYLMVFEPLGYKASSAVSAVTAGLAILGWYFVPPLYGGTVRVAVLVIGELLACLFGLWATNLRNTAV